MSREDKDRRRSFLPSLFKGSAMVPAPNQGAARATATAGYIAKGVPYTSGWNTERAVRDGLERDIWVFRCIEAIANNGSGRNMVVRDGDPDTGQEVDDPILPMLNVEANPFEDGQTLRWRILALLCVSKRGVMLEKIRNNAGQVIGAYILPPDRTAPIPHPTRFVSGFRVTLPNGDWNDLPAEDVLWIKRPHPTNMYEGLTPMEAAGIDIDASFYARLYNRTFMANDGRPGMLVAVKGEVSDGDAKEIKAKVDGGPGQAGRTAVIEADGLEVADLATTPRDAQYVETRKISKEAILEAFGVPESVIGNASGRTFDNADAEEEQFWRSTMLPLLRIMEKAFDRLTLGGPHDGRYVRSDLGDVHVLERDDRARADRLKAEFDAGLITVDEYRDGTGKTPLDVPGSRVLYLTAGGKVPVGADPADQAAAEQLTALMPGSPAPPGGSAPSPFGPSHAGQFGGHGPVIPARRPPIPAPDNDVIDGEVVDTTNAPPPLALEERRADAASRQVKALGGELDPVQPAGRFAWYDGDLIDAPADADPPRGRAREELRLVADERLTLWERAIGDALEAMWQRQEAVLLARLQGTKARQGTRHWTRPDNRPPVVTKALNPDELLPSDAVEAALAEGVEPVVLRVFGQASEDAVRRMGRASGSTGIVTDSPAVQEAVRRRIAQLANVSLDRAERVRKVIMDLDSDDADLDAILKAVRGTYAQRQAWAAAAARTTANSLAHEAALAAAHAAGATTKQWLSSHDEKVRPTHRLADGQERPIDEAFRVGQALLQYPADPVGGALHPEETVNCRCHLLFGVGGQAGARPDRSALAGVPAAAILPVLQPIEAAALHAFLAGQSLGGAATDALAGITGRAGTANPSLAYRAVAPNVYASLRVGDTLLDPQPVLAAAEREVAVATGLQVVELEIGPGVPALWLAEHGAWLLGPGTRYLVVGPGRMRALPAPSGLAGTGVKGLREFVESEVRRDRRGRFARLGSTVQGTDSEGRPVTGVVLASDPDGMLTVGRPDGTRALVDVGTTEQLEHPPLDDEHPDMQPGLMATAPGGAAGPTGDAAKAKASIPTVLDLIDKGMSPEAAAKEWARLYHNARFRFRRERLKAEKEQAKLKAADVKAGPKGEAPKDAEELAAELEGASPAVPAAPTAGAEPGPTVSLNAARDADGTWDVAELRRHAGRLARVTGVGSDGQEVTFEGRLRKAMGQWGPDEGEMILSVADPDDDGSNVGALFLKDVTDVVVPDELDHAEWRFTSKASEGARADVDNTTALPKAIYTPTGDDLFYAKQTGRTLGPGAVEYAGRKTAHTGWEAVVNRLPDDTPVPVVGLRIGDYHVKHGWAMRVNGRAYLVETDGATGELSQDDRGRLLSASAEVDKVLSAVPDEHAAKQRGTALLRGTCPDDVHWQKEYGQPDFHADASAGGGVTMWWGGRAPTAPLIAHEFGHNMDSQGWLNDTWASQADGPVVDGQPSSYEQARRDDLGVGAAFAGSLPELVQTRVKGGGGHPITLGTDGPTAYGGHNVREDFAESVRLYLKDRREGKLGYLKPGPGETLGTNVRFADLFPHRARQMDALFGMPAVGDTEFRTKQRAEAERIWHDTYKGSGSSLADKVVQTRTGLPMDEVHAAKARALARVKAEQDDANRKAALEAADGWLKAWMTDPAGFDGGSDAEIGPGLEAYLVTAFPTLGPAGREEVAKQARAGVQAAWTAQQEAAAAQKAAADAAAAQKVLLEGTVKDLNKDDAHYIRKRKALVKYRAKQETLTGAVEFTPDLSAAQIKDRLRAAVQPGAKVAVEYRGKRVYFHVEKGHIDPVTGGVSIRGMEVDRHGTLFAGGLERLDMAHVASIATVKKFAVSDADAQRMADEYEAAAVKEKLAAKYGDLIQHVETIHAEAKQSDGARLRPWSKATRAKAGSFLSKAGADKSPNAAKQYAKPQQAKANIAAELAARLNTPDGWAVFQRYRAHDAAVLANHFRAAKGPVKAYGDYTPAERQQILDQECANRVQMWAGTSGDTNPYAVLMQRAIKEEFGTEGDWKVRYGAKVEAQKQAELDALWPKVNEFYRLFARTMYDHTQAEFAAAGITHVSLYRGMRGMGSPEWGNKGVHRPPLQPANSWSSSVSIARRFGNGQGGVMLVAEIPVERVLGSARTGFGCLNEKEFVVLDTAGPVIVVPVGETTSVGSSMIYEPPAELLAQAKALYDAGEP